MMVEGTEVEGYLKFYDREFGKEILRKEVEFVESRLNNCKSVLSIGCGPALLESRLHQLHPEMNIVGLDSSREMLAHASKSIHLEYGDAHHLRFGDGVFDAVLFVTSLEFVEDYKEAVKEAHRVLKSKGTVLILMLNPKSDYFRNRYKDRGSYIRQNIKHMETESIKECANRYFSIEKEEYFLGIQDEKVCDSNNPKLASLYAIEGKK